LIGGALGVAGAAWAVAGIVPLAPSGFPRLDAVGVNVPVLAFTIAMLSVTGLVAGLVPAAQAWQSDLAVATREQPLDRGGGRPRRRRTCWWSGQIALSVPH
jgi:hypothetical protein